MNAGPPPYSREIWVMVNPARAFAYAASQPPDTGIWVVLRRPIFLAFVLSCVVSLAAGGTLTLRLAAPSALYWAYIPLTELVALVALIWTRRGRIPLAHAIDVFFSGHGPWMFMLVGVAASIAFLTPEVAWTLMPGPWLAALVVILAWSAYVDFRYFTVVLGARAGRAAIDMTLFRLFTWFVVFVIFAVPDVTPLGIAEEIVGIVNDLAPQ
jgi:hypothetical protein